MARGFESKDVEFQQAEAERGRTERPPLTADERARIDRRHTLTLSLANTRLNLAHARTDAHRRMLEQAIAALEADLDALSQQ